MVWLLAFAVMLVMVAGMAIGVMMGRKPIAGSCGGIGATGLDSSCGICGGNAERCEEASKAAQAAYADKPSLAKDATKVD